MLPPRARTLLACALTLLAVPAIARGEGWQKAPQPISPAGSNAQSAVVAIDPQQEAFVGWWHDSTDEVAIRRPGGSVATTSLGGTGPFFTPPALAAGRNGLAIAAFLDPSNVAQADLRPPGGSFAPVAGPLSAANASNLHVALTSNGTALLVFVRDDGHVRARTRPPGGSFSVNSTELYAGADGPASSLDVATDASGDAIVTFVVGSAPTVKVKSVLYSAGGFKPPQTVFVASVAPGDSILLSPRVAMDAAGDAAVVAAEADSSFSPPPPNNPTTSYIKGSVRSKASGAWSSPQVLDAATETGVFGPVVTAPAVTYDSSGTAVGVWLHTTGFTSPATMRAAASSGSTFGAPTNVATGPLGVPSVAPLPHGRTMLTFAEGNAVKFSVRKPGAAFPPPATAFSSSQSVIGSALAADPRGDVAAAWVRSDATMHPRAELLVYDATPPVTRSVTVPATAKLGKRVNMTASATDAFSPVSYLWAFGDGKTGHGARVGHAFDSRAGSFTVKVAAVDAAGNAGPAITRRIRITAVRPVVRSFRVKPSRFAVGSKPTQLAAARTRAPRGARIRYSLNEPATVKIAFARQRRGKPFTHVGTLRRRGKAGKNSIRFSGRLGSKSLRPGLYKATIVARVKGVAKASRKRSVKFRIVKR